MRINGRRSRTVSGAVGLLLLAPLLAAVPAAAQGQTDPAQPAAKPTAGADGSPRVVTLPTGDVVRVQTIGGRVAATVSPSDTGFATVRLGTGVYVIPGTALDQLGTRYRLADFNVMAQGGAPRVQSPWIPNFPMYNLTVNGIDANGAPANGGFVAVTSVDDGRKFVGFQSFFHGSLKFSVPAGVYAANALFGVTLPNGTFAFAQVELPQFTVSGTGSITVDARTATVQPTATPPSPAKLNAIDVTTERDSAGPIGPFGVPSYSSDLLTPTPGGVLVNDTSPVTVGALHYANYYSYATQHGPSGAPATFGLKWWADGAIPAEQAFHPSLSSLASVSTSYGDEGALHTGLAGEYSFAPWQTFAFFELFPIKLPKQRTEYVTALPGLSWGHEVSGDEMFDAVYVDNQHIYSPGQQPATEWFGEPQAPGFGQDTAPGTAFFCAACRQNNSLQLFAEPFVDPSGHLGFADSSQPGVIEQINTSVYANGALIGQQPNASGGVFQLPAAPSPIQVVIDTQRAAPFSPLSTSTQTIWSFTSAQQTTDGLPPNWQCLHPGKDCAPVPLVTAGYGLPLDLCGDLTTGPTVATLTLGHVAGAPAVPIVAATAQVSVDGGTKWTNAKLTLRPDGVDLMQFTTKPVSSTDGYLALRLVATDAAGASLAQTILQAARLVDPSSGTVASAPARAACPMPRAAEVAHCLALVAPVSGTAKHFAGYGAADLESAYGLPIGDGAGQTVAVVDAFDNPNAESDLATYRSRYGLPACTSANGCFKKVNEHGGSRLPPGDPGWGLEESLDLDMVSAACPLCHILLVEGQNAFFGDLGKAVSTAASMGAASISNSYDAPEFNGEQSFARFYNQPGHAVTVSTGDFGFGPAEFPANLATVTAVGGTTLTPAPGTARGWSEMAWSRAGSGCSAYVAKPAWQHDANCSMRTVADVSADADLATGVAVYDTYQLPGWLVVGGTSVGTPLIAGVYALAGNTATIHDASGLYARAGNLNDVVGGSNGYCGGDYLCTGLPGYDGPTGLGTPNGIGAF